MNIKKSIDLVEIVIDEIALEGLDGITLEALWQRLAMRLGDTLPLKDAFMDQIWKTCLELHDLTFFELENARDALVIFDRYELEYMSSELDKGHNHRDIYPHCPVEDVKLGIRGSCSTYYSRQDISHLVQDLTFTQVHEKYGQKLVIVASQNLREGALMDDTVSPIIQLSLAHYCLLERIGRTRKIGEISIKKSAHIKEDAKTLFYMRKVLLEQGLIRKQVYYQGNTGAAYNGQNMGTLIHLTRFYNVRKPKVIMWAEHLISYLKSKENYVAEYNEVKRELSLDYSIKKFFKIQMLQKVFRTDLKVPYRSYYPNSSDKEWHIKANVTKERILKLVTLADSNTEITDIWRTEEVKEDHDFRQLDSSHHKLNVPFLKQIYTAVESKEMKGTSQSELVAEMGLTKLTGRTLLRNLDKSKIVSSYLDDVGRQRTKKFVSKKFESQSLLKKQLEEEITKIKEHDHSIKSKKLKEHPNTSADKNKMVSNNVVIAETNCRNANLLTNTDSGIVQNSSKKDDQGSHKNLLAAANNILWKYKISKNRNKYRYTSSANNGKPLKICHLQKDECNKDPSTNEQKDTVGQQVGGIHDSDFYKMIETELVVQKPECKKKSQKTAVVGFMKGVEDCDNMQSTVSYRLIRRANLILDSVKEHKIIEDTQKLMKYINEEEDKEGLEIRMDKNSLLRLLQKLAEDKLIKYIKLVLKNKKHTKQKVVNFICDPMVREDDTVIQSAIEQAKLKFCMMETNIQNSADGSKKLVTAGDAESSVTKSQGGKYVIFRNDSLGKKYGYCPKFVRLKTMHIFLHYLIYDHPEKLEPKTEFFENLRLEGYLSDDLLDDDLDVYSRDICWKMFIPPLPQHRGYPKGWALIRDILLRMPLSIFVKVHNVNFEVPGLQEYLDHPVKKHFLMRDIPSPIRNLLFLRRKYMFSVHELVTRLCYLGLVQFGPQMLKEKDQVFVYLNRKTELLDTTSSSAGYHKIEDKPYPVTKFYFATLPDVEKYWYEMWNTCINTDLGGRNVVEGKDILLEDLPRKPEMMEAIRVKTVAEAEKDDTGFVPGDRKGAAGIDSAFFSHLKRNWNWVNAVQQSKMGKKSSWPPQTINLAKATVRRRVSNPRNLAQARRRPSPLKESQGKTLTESTKSAEKAAAKTKRHAPLNLSFIQTSKPPKVVRKVLPRKRALRKRVKYDEIDFSALQRMDKLRVDWEQHEDNILLVCKVAMVYLCPNPRRNPVTFTAIRDVLRSYSFTSFNKTSRACQRRLLYMLKQPKTVNSVLLGVEEIKQDYYVNKRFGGLVEKLRNESENAVEYEKKVEKVFKDLVTYIAKKYYNISDMEHREPVVLPKTIQEFNIFHKLKLPTKTISSPGVSKEVRDITDIHTATINSVIHSSMCCGKERRSWAYQLFRVYQQYPEYLLRSAMLKIRADQMVTMKKSYMCAYKKFGNCMPMSSSQYQLSSAYYYKFQTKWPYEVFSESYDMLLSLLENYVERQSKEMDGVEIKPGCGGMVAAVYDFLGTDGIDIDIEIPDQIIMLDPGLPEKDEVYQRIAVRYQSILNGLSSDIVDHRKSTTTENAESNAVDDASDQQQSPLVGRSMKRTIERDRYDLETKRQKFDDEEENLSSETHGTGLDAIKNESSKTMSPEKNVSASEPMVVDCYNAQNVDSLLFENQSWTHHLLDIQSCADAGSDTHLGIQIGDTSANLEPIEQDGSLVNPQAINKMQSFFDYIANKEDPSSESKGASIKVSELVKNVANWEAMEDADSCIKVQDVRTRQTRIAMLRMREELHDLTFHDSHHAHEYFVVNSFKLFSSLKVDDKDQNILTTYKDMNLPKALLPIDIEAADKILEDIKKFAIFPKTPIPYQSFKTEMLTNEQFDWNVVNSICKFIKSKREFGASLHELVTSFSYLDNTLADILRFLTEKRIVLRAGIVAVRYIYQQFTNPWIIHSYKILRLEKESHQTLPEGSVYVLDNEESTIEKEKEAKRVTTAANLFYSSPTKPHVSKNVTKHCSITETSQVPPDNDLKQDANIEESMERSNIDENVEIQASNSDQVKDDNADDVDGNCKSPKRLRRNRTVLLKQKDVYRAAKLLDFNTAEEIKVVIKPWIRIDGVLNRRVLDRMLGAVLCYCFEKPGTSLTNVQTRFTPAIQPYHTRELIEILTKLGCVKMSVQGMSKVTLFSKPAKLDQTGNADLIADSDSVFIEPTIQSTLKFGMFLSNRSYNLDFLSTL